MGSGGSTNVPKYDKFTLEEIVALMMPVYYTHNADITPEMLNIAKDSWLLITEDKCPRKVEVQSGVTLFYTTFYERLFDIHPLSKPLFKNGMQSQGKFIVKMIAMIINSLKYRDKFKKTMEDLALRHCQMGVKASEFSIVGDVLFYSLSTCLGSAYTRDVEDTWKKIYSAMLQIIVPLCLRYEGSGTVEKDEDSNRLQMKRLESTDCIRDKNVQVETDVTVSISEHQRNVASPVGVREEAYFAN